MLDYKTITNSSSTQGKAIQYEEHLIKILSLPLATNSRQLAIPHMAQNYNDNFFFCGEGFYNQQFSLPVEMKKLEPVNALSQKLNKNESLAHTDYTNNETYEAPSQSPLSEIDGVNNILETKIKPTVSALSKNGTTTIAKLEDMPVETQKKKGLLGLQFKIYKTTNPQTKRLCTKYVCTYDG